MEDEVKQTLNDLLDIALDLTGQIDALGRQVLTIRTVLEVRFPDLAREFEHVHTLAESDAATSDHAAAARVEEVIQNLKKRLL